MEERTAGVHERQRTQPCAPSNVPPEKGILPETQASLIAIIWRGASRRTAQRIATLGHEISSIDNASQHKTLGRQPDVKPVNQAPVPRQLLPPPAIGSVGLDLWLELSSCHHALNARATARPAASRPSHTRAHPSPQLRWAKLACLAGRQGRPRRRRRGRDTAGGRVTLRRAQGRTAGNRDFNSR
jgi:hypothetical protein